MYSLPYYKDKDPERVRAFIDQNPFAFISGCDQKNQPVATQIPVFLEEEDGKMFLRGHIMKNLDHHLAFAHNSNVLVVFSGPFCYVSATWYSNPNIPSTWNYMSVHARGQIRIGNDQDLDSILQQTSLYFEQNNSDSPTVYQNLPAEMREKLKKMIVAFEIEVQDMNHVFKLSQDRDQASYRNIIEELSKRDSHAKRIAEEMALREHDVFPKS